jgi:predicted MFS family arabinose efflux permease
VQFYAVFVTEVLHQGSAAYGLLAAAVGFGSLFGTAYVAWSAARKGRGRVLVFATMTYLSLVFLFTFQRHYWPAFVVLVLAGVFNSIYGAVCNSLIQQTVEDRFRGRVMSLYTMTFATIPLGGLLMGIVVSYYGTPFAFATFTAVAAVLCSLVFLFSPRLRRL